MRLGARRTRFGGRLFVLSMRGATLIEAELEADKE
jgi:hypothetical protein